MKTKTKDELVLENVLIPTCRIRVDENGCWVWVGGKSDDGYGVIYISGKREYIHRVIYQAFIGPVNNGRELDHLCRNRACCNPAHLEAVSSYENSIRGNHPLFVTHREQKCRKGHDLTIKENVRVRADGRCRCRICANDYQRARREKLKCGV